MTQALVKMLSICTNLSAEVKCLQTNVQADVHQPRHKNDIASDEEHLWKRKIKNEYLQFEKTFYPDSTVGKNSGEEMITEYTTTRRVDMTINGGMMQEAPGGYYTQSYGQ